MKERSFIELIEQYSRYMLNCNLTSEYINITGADKFWIKKRKENFNTHLTIKKGDVWKFEFGKAIVPEMAYIHMGLVIGIQGNLLYVLPITSINQNNKNHLNAYHKTSNPNGKKLFYLMKKQEFSLLSHDSLIKVEELKCISRKRIITNEKVFHISIDSNYFNEVIDEVMRLVFPTISHKFNQLNENLNVLQKENDDNMKMIIDLKDTIDQLQKKKHKLEENFKLE